MYAFSWLHGVMCTPERSKVCCNFLMKRESCQGEWHSPGRGSVQRVEVPRVATRGVRCERIALDKCDVHASPGQ
jgi:hypothetical protein